MIKILITSVSLNCSSLKLDISFNDSTNLSITDFSYEVIDENKLKVFIEFSVVASEKELEIERNEEFLDEEDILLWRTA